MAETDPAPPAPPAPSPPSPGWHFTDNDLKAMTEIGRWVLAAIAVVAMMFQQHNQHAERIGTLKSIEKNLVDRHPHPVFEGP